jgi:hypothetical protein
VASSGSRFPFIADLGFLVTTTDGVNWSNNARSFFDGGTLTAFVPERKLFTPQSSKRSEPSKMAKPKLRERISIAMILFGLGLGFMKWAN